MGDNDCGGDAPSSFAVSGCSSCQNGCFSYEAGHAKALCAYWNENGTGNIDGPTVFPGVIRVGSNNRSDA